MLLGAIGLQGPVVISGSIDVSSRCFFCDTFLMRGWLWLCCVGFFGLALMSQARPWTDLKGRSIEADYVSSTRNEVKLRKPDGSILTVKLEQITPEDRAYVRRQPDVAFQELPEGLGEEPEEVRQPAVKGEGGLMFYKLPLVLQDSRTFYWLMGVGFLLLVLTGFVMMVQAFRTSIWWGLGYLFIPFVGFVFIFLNFGRVFPAFIWHVVGFVLLVSAGLFMPPELKEEFDVRVSFECGAGDCGHGVSFKVVAYPV